MIFRLVGFLSDTLIYYNMEKTLTDHLAHESSLGYTTRELNPMEYQVYLELSNFIKLEKVFCGFCVFSSGNCRNGKEFEKFHICRRSNTDLIYLYYYDSNDNIINVGITSNLHNLLGLFQRIMPEKFVLIKPSNHLTLEC